MPKYQMDTSTCIIEPEVFITGQCIFFSNSLVSPELALQREGISLCVTNHAQIEVTELAAECPSFLALLSTKVAPMRGQRHMQMKPVCME